MIRVQSYVVWPVYWLLSELKLWALELQLVERKSVRRLVSKLTKREVTNVYAKVLIFATIGVVFLLCIVFGAFAIDGDIVFTHREIVVGVFLIIFGAFGFCMVTCKCCMGVGSFQVHCNVSCCFLSFDLDWVCRPLYSFLKSDSEGPGPGWRGQTLKKASRRGAVIDCP